MSRSTPPSLQARSSPLAAPATQREALHQVPLPREFDEALRQSGLHPLRPSRLDIFQMNLGKMCNQTCRHCHVDAGPDRREVMSRETMELCLAALAKTSIPTVDLTGGAPEMNPHFRWLVEEVRKLGRHVMDRCNLTILETKPHYDLPGFLAEHRVEVVCSLPHYRALNTDKQRGEGVYEQSIRALKRLNALGYGDGQSGPRLVLVANPVGAFLPAGQASLEAEWKRELLRHHGIRFDSLYALTNMPISRFLEWLRESGNLDAYLQRLVSAFNPAAARGVMCRNTLSVGWDGQLYDCDFNQMLELPVEAGAPRHIRDFDLAALEARALVTDRHCFGCTAGAGSSCGGATT
ncbi:MAG TPA: arsenosugar biosynthesis radical SAM (seleno)protein ArsS [Archangium sp.]|uniref:arsenosugar biosynthesis radical SAM (seleno)protein ArsS n=1 Tax=Archangium sp. TaxID=1872627 RepID=UPI002E3057BE|nr:arsenosugar biosynthesis radical SAM (seleno)protein ArsS [Archangium sp.]HEX5754281.1 arsenosugar biosynthesis radical SAM (seleno)protein ArsS [Archangium sp.]